MSLTHVEHAVQLNVVRPGHDRGVRHVVVDQQTEHGGRQLEQVHRVPVVVVAAGLGRVAEADGVGAGPDVDQDVPVDELSQHEVVVLAAVVEQHARSVLGLEPEVHVRPGVRLQRRQPDIRVFGQERNGTGQRRRFVRFLVLGRHVHLGQVVRVCRTTGEKKGF